VQSVRNLSERVTVAPGPAVAGPAKIKRNNPAKAVETSQVLNDIGSATRGPRDVSAGATRRPQEGSTAGHRGPVHRRRARRLRIDRLFPLEVAGLEITEETAPFLVDGLGALLPLGMQILDIPGVDSELSEHADKGETLPHL